jgi:hypothetical protein
LLVADLEEDQAVLLVVVTITVEVAVREDF